MTVTFHHLNGYVVIDPQSNNIFGRNTVLYDITISKTFRYIQNYLVLLKSLLNKYTLVYRRFLIPQTIMEDSLTGRLTFLMNQVSVNRISQIIIEDRLQKERCYGQRQKMLSYANRGSFYDKKQNKNANLRGTESFRNKQSEVPLSDTPKKMGTVGAIWGLSRRWKESADKDSDNRKNVKKSDSSEPGKSNFVKAARNAVILAKVTCTCETLDSRCMMHDA